jgi:hypothetical protein
MAIEHADADVVLVDETGIVLGMDVVRNYIGSDQRPKVMAIRNLSKADLRILCKRFEVRLFDRRHASQAGIPLAPTPDLSGERAILPSIGCDTPLPLH